MAVALESVAQCAPSIAKWNRAGEPSRGNLLGGRRLAALALLALTGALPSWAQPLPSRDINNYVLFATDSLAFKGDDASGTPQTRGLITGGHVGVNRIDATHNPPSPLLSMCGGGSSHRVIMSDGTQVVADTAAFQSPCNLYDVFANVVNGGSAPVVRDVGPSGFSAPVIATNQLPTLPSFTAGATTVTVSSNTTLNLAPGTYGGVTVQDDGTLNLSAGTYVVAFLHGGKRMHMNATDTTVVLAAQDITTNNDATIGPSCLAQFSARSDSVGSNNFTIAFSRNTEAHGQFFAPNGTLNLGDSTDLFGRFVAKNIGSGWNTNVTYCGTGSPITTPTFTATSVATATRTSTPTPTLTSTVTDSPTATRTNTPPPTATPIPTNTRTNTPGPTSTSTATGAPTASPSATPTTTLSPSATPTASATETATPTATPTDTATPTATASDVATATATATVTATATETPTGTDTPTETATPTSTATTTPIPPGVIVGEVYDDGSAQPLADVTAQLSNTNSIANTDEAGAYTLPAAAGEQIIALTLDGYTRNLRRLTVPPGRGGQVLDGRLTALAAPVTIDGNGGTVHAAYKAPGSAAADVTLDIPPAALTSPAAVQLTVLSPQGLIAPLPLGWSVLLGVDLRGTSTIASPITLHVPLSLFALSGSLPIAAARWDDGTQQWLGGPTAAQVGNALEIAIDEPSAVSQIALIVADTEPAAPPGAMEGQSISGVSPLAAVGDSGFVVADPPAIVAGSGARAQVLTQVHGLEPLSSGTVLNAALRETYDLRDGRSLTGTVADEDIVAYQLSPTTGTHTSTTLGAYFNLIPSRNYTLSELSAGRVDIDLSVPVAGGDLGVVGPGGGAIDGSGGLHLVVPPNAVSQTTVIRLHPAPPARLPAGVNGRPDLAGTFEIVVNGGVLDPSAAYEIDLGTNLTTGDRFAITQLVQDDQGSVLKLIGFGTAANGRIVFDACAPGVSLCLDGLAGNATYVVFKAAAGAAEVTGTVRDTTGPRAGVRVQSTTSPVVSISDAAGQYVLLVPDSVSTTLTARDPVHGLSGQVTVTPVGSTPIFTADIFLAPTVPQVTEIDPPNHGSQVASGATITVTFSEPIATASISDVSVTLTEAASPLATVESHKSLSADGTLLLITPAAGLAPNTLYRVSLTAQVTNRVGTALLPFSSDFTTASVFQAAALPPNTLRVSIPVDDQGNPVDIESGQAGKVFVCGGAQLAAPGTAVAVIDAASGLTVSATATDAQGHSGSDTCDFLFPGRCNTSQPGSFCAVIDAATGDRIQVQVQDVLHNTVIVDAGNMQDERTGATVVGTEGATVVFPGAPDYRAIVPAGAFLEPTIVQITPITDGGPGFSLTDFPALIPTDPSAFDLVGAVQLVLSPPDRVAQKHLDLTFPAPPAASVDDQYIMSRVVNFRDQDELTMVDTGAYDPDRNLVISQEDNPFLPYAFTGGTFGMHRTGCFGYVTGFVGTGNVLGNAFVQGGVAGSPMNAPVVSSSVSAPFVVPLPCNHQVEVDVLTADGQLFASQAVTVPDRRQFITLPFTLGPAPSSLEIIDRFPASGATGVDPLVPAQIVVNAPLDKDAVTHVQLLDCGTGPVFNCGDAVAGHATLSDDTIITFEPDARLQFDHNYRLVATSLQDITGHLTLSGIPPINFTTFKPQVLARIEGVDARDVAVIDSSLLAGQGDHQLIAIADATMPDPPKIASGVVVYDVTPNATTGTVSPQEKVRQVTRGADSSIAFVSGPSIRAQIQSGPNPAFFEYPGPFLMSLDGMGTAFDFGVWHLFTLEHYPQLDEAAVRTVNLSTNAYNTIFGIFPDLFGGGALPPSQQFPFVELDVGVPEDLAAVNNNEAQIVYIANPPFLGIQAILTAELREGQDVHQVDGRVNGVYRAVATLRNDVVASKQDKADSSVVLLRPQLSDTGTPDLDHPNPPAALEIGKYGVGASIPRTLTTLQDWPVRFKKGDDDFELRPRDLVVVQCQGSHLCVIPVNAATYQFDTSNAEEPPPDGTALPRGPGDFEFGSNAQPEGTVGDADEQLLYVANGNAGLAIVDLSDPGGTKLKNGADERLIATVPLPLGANIARRVAFYHDSQARPMVAVAAGNAGVFLVQVGPPRFTVSLTKPNPNEEFKMNMAGPTMPVVTLEAAVKPQTDGLTYQFKIAEPKPSNPTTLRALRYENAPAGYVDPPPLISPVLSVPTWDVDFGTDIYGGHVTRVTVSVFKNGAPIASKTFNRDFFIVGDFLDVSAFDAYVASQVAQGIYDPAMPKAARAVPRSETGGVLEHFQFHVPGHQVGGSVAYRDGYPVLDSRGGYGLFALTSLPVSRDQIWNWKANTDDGLKRIDKELRNARNCLQNYLTSPPDDQVRLQAYAKYNGGSHGYYFKASPGGNGANCQFDVPLVRDPTYSCGCVYNGGKYSKRHGYKVGPPSGPCLLSIGQCYADLTQTFE